MIWGVLRPSNSADSREGRVRDDAWTWTEGDGGDGTDKVGEGGDEMQSAGEGGDETAKVEEGDSGCAWVGKWSHSSFGDDVGEGVGRGS